MTGLIAVPCTVQGRWSSFWACVEELDRPEGAVCRTGRGNSPAANRNGLIEEAKAGGAEWIWFLDDDLTFRPDALKRLLRHFDDPTTECVVPLSFMRREPFRAIWFNTSAVPEDAAMMDWLPPPGQLIFLEAATFGGMLIRLSAIEKIEKPYITIGQIRSDEWNDDLYFCRKLRAAGVEIWGDSSVQMGHTTDVEVWPHYDPERGWSVVLGRGQRPFCQLPWGATEREPAGVA